MTRSSPLLGVVSLLALAAAGPARADYFYLWSADTPTALSDHSGMQVNLTPGGTAVPTGPVTGTQSVVAASLSTFVNPGVTGTDTFSQGQRLALGLQVTDGTDSEKVSFHLGVSGSLSAGGASQLVYSFLDGLTRDLTVNGHQYLVTLDPSIGSPGRVTATIALGAPAGGTTGGGSSGGGSTGGSTSTPPSNAPEPSGLVLAALGTASLTPWCRGLWGRLRTARRSA
jgi:hypothetical protein